MDKYLKIFIYILVSLILLALGAFGFWLYQEKLRNNALREITYEDDLLIQKMIDSKTPAAPKLNSKTSGWKTYRNEEYGFEIKYPGDLITLLEGNKIKLIHSIPFEHLDPCEFRDNVPPLKELTDFDVSIEVFNKNLKETMIASGQDYLTSDILPNNALKIEPGFIDKSNIGSLEGYRVTSSVEGCGEFVYYSPLTANKTLVVTRSFITEFKPIVLDYEKYLSLPGVISPSEEEELFTQILSSFRFLD